MKSQTPAPQPGYILALCSRITKLYLLAWFESEKYTLLNYNCYTLGLDLIQFYVCVYILVRVFTFWNL